jgi:hypothetical protein
LIDSTKYEQKWSISLFRFIASFHHPHYEGVQYLMLCFVNDHNIVLFIHIKAEETSCLLLQSLHGLTAVAWLSKKYQSLIDHWKGVDSFVSALWKRTTTDVLLPGHSFLRTAFLPAASNSI